VYQFNDLHLGDQLARNATTALHRAGAPDGRDLLVRVPVDPADARARLELDNERRLAELAEGEEAVLTPLTGNGAPLPFLAYADPGLEPLSRWNARRNELAPALALALAIGRALERLHDRGLVHLRLQPGAVLIGPESDRVLFTDLGLARVLADEATTPIDPTAVPQDLAWISPEQTGRVDASIDQRTDLYALGVLLYQLFSGRLPLEATSASQWVHCHLALKPRRLEEAAPGCPKALSRIIDRLLEKNPDDRYASARSLVADLDRCRQEWERSGVITPFTPGRTEATGRLHRPDRLHGRADEAGLLAGALRQPGDEPGLILLTGPPGVGKTFLIDRVLEQHDGPLLVLRSKGDPARSALPYDVLLQALHQLGSEAASPQVGDGALLERLRSAAGAGGRALLDLAPGLSALLGELPSLPELPPEQARNRLHLACRRLLQACGRPDRPLLLVLDDLHEADRATLDLLGELLRSGETRSVLVLGAWRESQASPELVEVLSGLEASRTTVTRIRLDGLPADEVVELVAETLGEHPDAVRWLGVEVARRTAGNPFFVSEVLAAAVRAGDLRFDRDGARWRWDADRIRDMSLHDGAVGLVGRRLDQLPTASRAALARAACVGAVFPEELLAACGGWTAGDLAAALVAAREAGLIVAAPAGRWRFSHDRIQEAALAQLGPDQRTAEHLLIGRTLAERRGAAPGEEPLFQAAMHLNQARALLQPEERRELAALNLEAGRQALATASRPLAAELLEAGLGLADDRWWQTDYDLTLDLHVLGAQAALLVARPERADALIERVRRHGRTPLDRSRVLQLQVQRSINQLRLPEALELGLGVLEELGVPVDVDPSPEKLPAALAGVEAARAGRTFDELASMAEIEDPVVRAALQTLCDVIPAATMARPELAPPLTVAAIRLVLEHGLCPAAATACSTWGLLLCIFGQHDQGYAFGELAVRLMHRYPGDATAAMVAVQFPVFIQHHREPVRAVVRRLEEGAVRCLEAGSLDNYGYCENQGFQLALLAGEPLAELEEAFEEGRRRLLETGQDLAASAMDCFGQVVANLVGRWIPGSSSRLAGERFDLEPRVEQLTEGGALMAVFFAHLCQLVLAAVFGDLEAGLRSLRAARPLVDTCRSMFVQPVYDFHAALVLVAAMGDDGADLEALKAELREHHDRLRAAARTSPQNHGFRLDLVEGRLAAVEGRDAQALTALDRGIRAAGHGGFVMEAALGHELTAGLHASLHRPAACRAHLLAARCIHQTWGAAARAEQLEGQLVHLSEGGMPFSPSPASPSTGSLDLDMVLQVAEVISGQMDLDRLVSRLLRFAMENAGAGVGLLFLGREGRRSLFARGRVEDERIEVHLQRGADPGDEAVERAVDYVVRTRTSLALDDARRSWPFPSEAGRPGRLPRSLLALPLESRGDLVGVLYLENDLVRGAFTRSRVDLLRVVASLAATMLENARLLATLSTTSDALRRSNSLLESYSSDLEGRVDQRTRELAGLYRDHQLILESIEEGILRLDGDGRITFSNPAAERLTGWSSDLLHGRSHHVLLESSSADAIRKDDCPLCRPPAETAAEGPVVPRELLLHRRRGEPLPVELAARPIRGPDGERAGTVVTFRDITRRRQLQTQLEHAQRLETLGRFVGAVAHDFNNLLTPLMGGAAQLLDENDLEPDSRHLLENMERASRRASELVQQMLAFGRRTKIFMQPTDLGAVVDEVAGFLHHALARGIQLEVDRPDGAAWTWGDRVQIHQVLLNLCVNAQDALDGVAAGGEQPRIRIAVREVQIGPEQIPSDAPAEPGRFLRLEVSDNGPGIPAETARRMFEPFFTTKEGKGTGLGLSVVYGIVRGHQGWVTCDTAPGRGATFGVYLPARTPASGEWAMVSTFEGEAAERHVGRILVVDDEAMVRDLVATSLRRRGHEVLEACNGRQALEIYAAQGDTIDLVLLDLVMPELAGEEALARLLEVDPGARVCLVSGYAEGTAAESNRELGATGFLAKPFTVRQLADLVQNALER